MKTSVRKILEKQMQLLSERAEKEDLNGIKAITDQLITLATLIDPELRETFKTATEMNPCVGYSFNWLQSQNPESADTPSSES